MPKIQTPAEVGAITAETFIQFTFFLLGNYNFDQISTKTNTKDIDTDSFSSPLRVPQSLCLLIMCFTTQALIIVPVFLVVVIEQLHHTSAKCQCSLTFAYSHH